MIVTSSKGKRKKKKKKSGKRRINYPPRKYNLNFFNNNMNLPKNYNNTINNITKKNSSLINFGSSNMIYNDNNINNKKKGNRYNKL